MNSGGFLQVLTANQIALLQKISRSFQMLPPNESREFMTVESKDGDGAVSAVALFPRPVGQFEIVASDLRTLINEGLLSGEPGVCGLKGVQLTGRGQVAVKEAVGIDPCIQIERHFSGLLGQLPEDYSGAWRRLQAASIALASATSEEDYSSVGHHCREAVQDFARVFAQGVSSAEEMPAEKTLNKVATKLRSLESSTTNKELSKAIEKLWVATNSLIQKVEHRSQRAKEPLRLADARRCVFLTAFLFDQLAELTQSDRQGDR
ncbi:MAG: hypothetical protein RL885_14690 [Planctomycetota bacterium]